MQSLDLWQPVVAAIAAFIALQGPAVANLLVSIATRKRSIANGEKLDEVHANTNSTLESMRGEISALSALVSDLHHEIEGLRGTREVPPDPQTPRT
jgi:hypothetical protein